MDDTRGIEELWHQVLECVAMVEAGMPMPAAFAVLRGLCREEAAGLTRRLSCWQCAHEHEHGKNCDCVARKEHTCAG